MSTAKARLDADRTAKPKTRIIHHPRAGKLVWPGMGLARPELEEIETGKRTPIHDFDAIFSETGDRTLDMVASVKVPDDEHMRQHPCPYKTVEDLRKRRRKMSGQPNRAVDPGFESDKEFVERWHRIYTEENGEPTDFDF